MLDRGQDGAAVLLTTRIAESQPKSGFAADAAKEDALSQTRPQPQYVHAIVHLPHVESTKTVLVVMLMMIVAAAFFPSSVVCIADTAGEL